jgi:hypothetical protein
MNLVPIGMGGWMAGWMNGYLVWWLCGRMNVWIGELISFDLWVDKAD